jgi:hypothetical protein
MLRNFFNLADELRKPLKFLATFQNSEPLEDKTSANNKDIIGQSGNHIVEQLPNYDQEDEDDATFSEYHSMRSPSSMSVSDLEGLDHNSIITMDNDSLITMDNEDDIVASNPRKRQIFEDLAHISKKFKDTAPDPRFERKRKIVRNKLQNTNVTIPKTLENIANFNMHRQNNNIDDSIGTREMVKGIKRKTDTESFIPNKRTKDDYRDRRLVLKKKLSRSRYNKPQRKSHISQRDVSISQPIFENISSDDDMDLSVTRKRKAQSDAATFGKRERTLPIDLRHTLK